MKIKFIGNPHGDDKSKVCEMMGKVFVLGQVVDVSDLTKDQKRRLSGNHHFEVVEAASGSVAVEHVAHVEPEAVKRGRGRPKKVTTDGDHEPDAE